MARGAACGGARRGIPEAMSLTVFLAVLGAALAASFPFSDTVAVLDPAAEWRRLQPAAQPVRPDSRSQSQPRNKDIQP